jgi:hypothetical protein
MANVFDQFDTPAKSTLSKMSTEDLLRAYQGTAPAPAPTGDLSSMSTEDLLRAYQQPEPAKDVQGQVSIPYLGKPSLIGMAKGLWNSAKSAATLPGDVYAGKVDPTSEEGIKRAADMAMLTQMGGRASVARREATAPLSNEEILSLTSKGYNEIRDAMRSVPLSEDYLKNVQGIVADHVNNVGPRAKRAPEAHAAIEDLAKGKDMGDLIDSWRNLRDIAKMGGEEGAAAKMGKNALEVAIDQQNPGLVQSLKDLDKNWAIAKTVQEREQLLKDAITAGASSGPSAGKRIQQAFAPLLKKGRDEFMSPEVKASVEDVVKPGIGIQALRAAEKLDPRSLTGAALQTAAGIKTGGLSLLTAPALMAAGTGARAMQDRIMQNRARTMLDTMRAEAPANMAQPGYQAGGNIGLAPLPAPFPLVPAMNYPDRRVRW